VNLYGAKKEDDEITVLDPVLAGSVFHILDVPVILHSMKEIIAKYKLLSI
jgi:hypothetical protein